MTALSVPVNVIDADPFEPEENDRPEVPDRLSVPCETLSVILTGLLPASLSLVEIRFEFAVENVSWLCVDALPFASTVCEPGTVFTGAWLT